MEEYALVMEGLFFNQARKLNSPIVRSVESARCDGAIYLGDPKSLAHQTSTDHSFKFYQRIEDGLTEEGPKGESFVLFAFKSISPSFVYVDGRIEYVKWQISLTTNQARAAQFLVIGTPACRDYVAIVPIQHPVLSTGKNAEALTPKQITFSIGHMKVAEGASMALPPALWPYMLPYSKLNKALESIKVCAENSDQSYINPLTKFQVNTWRPQKSTFRNMMPPAGSTESYRAIFKLYRAFKASAHNIRLEFLVCIFIPSLNHPLNDLFTNKHDP
jgi:hypothetical protein